MLTFTNRLFNQPNKPMIELVRDFICAMSGTHVAIVKMDNSVEPIAISYADYVKINNQIDK